MESEFSNGIIALKGKKLSVGCGAQGLNQGLNMRFRLIFLTLCELAIAQRELLTNAADNGFSRNYEELIPTADLVCNLHQTNSILR
jgi:ketol-acid reductoisomerase